MHDTFAHVALLARRHDRAPQLSAEHGAMLCSVLADHDEEGVCSSCGTTLNDALPRSWPTQPTTALLAYSSVNPAPRINDRAANTLRARPGRCRISGNSTSQHAFAQTPVHRSCPSAACLLAFVWPKCFKKEQVEYLIVVLWDFIEVFSLFQTFSSSVGVLKIRSLTRPRRTQSNFFL